MVGTADRTYIARDAAAIRALLLVPHFGVGSLGWDRLRSPQRTRILCWAISRPLQHPRSCTTVELPVRDLGFPHGAITATIYIKAAALGLCLGPLELGPHFRLHYRDQPVRQHQAPSGSITIASASLTPDDDFPKGFYVRRIQGVLWLRSYRAGPDHVWEADDHLLFCQT